MNLFFDRSLEFINKSKVETSEFYILTPFPNTPSWNKYKKEERLLHTNWTKYNTANAVFEPKNMTAETLEKGYLHCWKEYYSAKDFNGTINVFKP
jgi:radical SAM superfamily enzyme YgiQ (UPF0313 family)